MSFSVSRTLLFCSVAPVFSFSTRLCLHVIITNTFRTNFLKYAVRSADPAVF